MSYTRQIGNLTVHVDCAADPEANYHKYRDVIQKEIERDGYIPKTTMDNLITMVILFFDCDDNYGEYDPETGDRGYGNIFTLDECLKYVDDCGGWQEFDYYC